MNNELDAFNTEEEPNTVSTTSKDIKLAWAEEGKTTLTTPCIVCDTGIPIIEGKFFIICPICKEGLNWLIKNR